MKKDQPQVYLKKSGLSFMLSAMVLITMFLFSACGDDDETDACAGTDLAVSASPGESSIEAEGTGGTSPYEYSIDGSTFQSSGSFTGLDIEEYTVTVRDANNCTATTTVTPTDPAVCAASDLAVTATPGVYSIEAEGTGGTSPYEYSIDGTTFQSSGTFTDLAVQDYTVTVRDAIGCTATVTVTGESIDPCPDSDLDVTASGELLTITAVGTGGVEPYEYSIDGTTFQSSGTFEDLDTVDYTVTVRDSYECTSTVEVSKADLTTFTDTRDGYAYKIVKIGDQVWLGESLKYEPQADTVSSCYDELADNCADYGRLYDWEAAQLVAPDGWHLPDSTEWNTLIDELGGEDEAGEGLLGLFNAELGGFRNASGNYAALDITSFFWTSSEAEEDETRGIYYSVVGDSGNVGVAPDDDKVLEMSVRLILD